MIGVPGVSSAGVKSRPRAGATPSILKRFAETYAPGTWSGVRPSFPTLKAPLNRNDIPENVRLAARQSSKSRSDTPNVRLCVSCVPRNMTCSGFGTGRLRRRMALTIVKTALLAPIPSASTTTATTVNERFFARRRTAYRTSRNRSMQAPLDGDAPLDVDLAKTDYWNLRALFRHSNLQNG